MTTVDQVFRSRATDASVGLRFEDRDWTWAEVVGESAARAAALPALCPQPAGRPRHIGVLLDNVPDYVFWLGAAAMSGTVLVGINPSRRGTELAQDIRHADCDVIITNGEHAALIAGLDLDLPGDRIHDIDSPAHAALLAPLHGVSPPDLTPAHDDLFLLLFSSGSTGAPKAVRMSQGRLGRFAAAAADRVGIADASVTYLCMPLFHGNAIMMNLVPALAVGATVGMVRKFSASRFSGDVHRLGATYVNYVGRALSYVVMTPEDPRDRSGSLRLAFGTEASEADIAAFSARFGCEVMEGYGMSEGVFRIARTAETPPGALGLPAGGADVRVLDEEGRECPRAEFDATGRLRSGSAIGEIVGVGLAPLFEGYYENPAAEAERVRGDDFWTGDLAYRDQDGHFWFAGRATDWLRVDSENFSAAPVERILARCPGVAAACVYAVPDPRTGDQVMCALEYDAHTDFDPAAFRAFLDAQADLGTKWRPRFVRVVERLPLTGSGKVDKAPLRRQAWLTDDAVWVREPRGTEYVRLGPDAVNAITAQFEQHRRVAHLPQG